jgi:serine/threonine protein kinase
MACLMLPSHDPDDTFVLKRLRLPRRRDGGDWDHEVHCQSLSKVQREASTMERLTASPRIVNIFGHCGTSILAETMPKEISEQIIPASGHAQQAELEHISDVRPKNNFTLMEKLNIALTMSESIADMHGFDGGVIVNGDIHPVQWLFSVDGTIKLNDFNNAAIPDWNPEKGEYCKVDRGQWGGMVSYPCLSDLLLDSRLVDCQLTMHRLHVQYRAPEEFVGTPIDEQIDVYSMGNNIYTLLTGLWPFYEDKSYSVIQEKILRLERPFVDKRYHRSFIETRLITIMERMWAHEASDRPTIFEVVSYLRETKNIFAATSF